MTPETFCEHFSTFAEAPSGVAKLRELILQLAFQGKLVKQDVKDEPARVLTHRIETFSAQRVEEKQRIGPGSSGLNLINSLRSIQFPPEEIAYERSALESFFSLRQSPENR